MGPNTEIENAVDAARDEAQYDMQAKRLLSHKEILAQILIGTVDDFRGMKPADVVKLIEGDIQVGKVPVEPGMTNAEHEPETGKRIVGMNTENSEINEGTIRYDLIFYVRIPTGKKGAAGIAKVIVNIEMQKSEPTTYEIINRAIFYVSRMISSQKERDFVSDNYDGLQKVYSIWIVMGTKDCTLNHICLEDHKLLGNRQWKGNLDLINIVMIGMPKELPEQDKEERKLHRLLGALFSKDLKYDEKMQIIKDEYHIEADANMRKEMTQMCNLGEGIRESTENEFIINMHKDGDSDEKIARVSGKSIADVQEIIKNAQSVMV